MTVPHNAEQMGTGPNSPLEPRRTLVLGTSPMTRELAQAYQRLGNETQTGTVSQAREFRPQLIATTGDSPNTLAEVAAVAEETGAEVAPSVSACHHTADRLAVRKQASEELGLPTLDYEFASTPQEMQDAIERIGYPCVVKAPTSNDGEGFSFVRSSGDLAVAWSNADRGVGQGAVVERFIDFDFECTILAARSIDPETGQLATWFCEPIGTHHREGRLVEAWQPAPLPQGAMDNARSIAARITGALASCGVFSIELFVSGDDVYFSQVTPRPSRDGLVTLATQRVNQFDLQARATQKLPIDSTLVSPGAVRFLPGVRPSLEAIAAAMAVEETTVRLLNDDTLIFSTADSAAEARVRTDKAARAMKKAQENAIEG